MNRRDKVQPDRLPDESCQRCRLSKSHQITQATFSGSLYQEGSVWGYPRDPELALATLIATWMNTFL